MKSKKVICSGGIVVNKNKGIVIVNQNNDSWSLPKGHVEANESFIDAAKREIFEESGLQNIKLIKSLGSYDRYRIGLTGEDDQTELKTIYMFLFTTKQNKLQPLDPLNPEAIWASIPTVQKLLTHKKDKEFFLQQIKEFQEYLK